MTEASDHDLTALISNLNEINAEVLNDSLQRLVLFCQSQQKNQLTPHFQSLFEKFPILLMDENMSVIVQASQLLIEISTQFPREAERYFGSIMKSLILNLADSKPVVRKMAFNCLSSYIQMTNNFDEVYFKLTEYGILHSNPQTRQKCIIVINNFMLTNSSCITSSYAFQKTIEKVLEKSNEPIDTVRSACYQVITHLNNHYQAAFGALMKKLSFSDQEKVRQILKSPDVGVKPDPYEHHGMQTKSPFRGNDSSQDLERSTTPRKLNDTYESPNRVQKSFKMTTKKTAFAPLNSGKQLLRYGAFEPRVIEDAGNTQDWRVRLAATEEILKVVEGLDTMEAVVPFMGDFLELIMPLLSDSNFKVCINCLNILGIVVKITNKNDLASQIENVVTGLLAKLGDSKVAVRQIAFQILVSASQKMNVQEFLYLIFDRLAENNWHMREECLLLIQMTFTSSPNEFQASFYEETVENIIETLDDQKPKVRNTARETIVGVLRHSSKAVELLNKISPLLEKELYEYMLFRIQNPENFPRNNYTPYTEDSGMDARESLTMTGKTDSDHDRNTSGMHFRSMTTSPREPTMMNSMATSHSRNNVDSIASNSPYRKPTYENSTPFQGNSTGYSNSSSNGYFNHPHENSRYSRNTQISSPYEKKQHDSENSPNLSSFGTPYTKASLNTPDSHQRFGNTSYTNQSGYYPKVHTPYQNSKGPYEISTASSSRSGYSRHTNTIYSFDASSISNSSILEKAKLSKQQQQQQTVSYANMLDSRIQSAQNGIESSANKSTYSNDKRTYSATEELAKTGSSGFQNKLSKKAAIPNNETYLEYSITKKLDDFTSNNFENHDSYGTFDQSFEPQNKQDVFSSIDSFQTQDLPNSNLKQNPYRGTRPDLAQKLKKFQAQQHQVIMEADESRRTNKKENNEGTNDKRKPPLPSHKRMVSQNTQKEIEKTQEKEGSSSEDEDNSFSIKNNLSRGLKRKVIPKNSEALTVPEYKKLDYLTKEQLQPIEGNMESILKSMNNDLKSDDWQKQFEASNTLRRFLQFHNSFLASSFSFNLHSVTQDILKMVESLRSNLAKNGLITLTEMCGTLKKQMDSEAEMVAAKLIKKGTDANSFICEEVKKAFVALCQNCSDTKIIPLLASILHQKSSAPKIHIAVGVESIIAKNESRVNQLRDFDKIVVILGNYMLDSAVEVRNASKQAMNTLINFLFNKSEMDKILQRSFTEANFKRLNTIISKELNSGTSTLMITNSQTGKVRSSSFKPKAPASRGSLDDEEDKVETKPMLRTKVSSEMKESQEPKDSLNATSEKTKKPLRIGGKEPQEFENLPALFTQAEASDWKSRFDAANALAEVGRKSGDNLHRSKMHLKYFDQFTKLIQDSNIKVSSAAIGAFIELIPILRSSIESNVINVSNASLTVLGSVNAGIKSNAENLFETISSTIDHNVLIPAWTNNLPYTNIKAKVTILSKLNELCPSLYSKKPTLVTKNIIPVLSKCIEETKAEVKNSTHQVLNTLYGIMGRELFDYVPANKVQIISDIVQSK